MPSATDRRRARLYLSGLSLRRVAELERCAPSTVLLSLRAAGVPSRPAHTRRDPRPVPYLAEARRLLAAGMSYAEIGRRVGRSGEAVRLALKRDPLDS